jgi:hypothetical protein
MENYNVCGSNLVLPADLTTDTNVNRGARGWKADLLLPLPEQVPLVAGRVSRRQMLKTGTALAAGVAGFGLVRPRESEAGILAWFGAAIFAGGISWVVGKALDALFPDDPKRLGMKQVRSPAPIPGNDFHNQFAEPWVITNPDWHLRDRHLAGFGVTFGLREYLRLTDLNVDEITCNQREFRYYGPIPSSGPRRPLTYHDRRDLPAVERAYDTEIADHHVRYVRDFNDGDGNAHIGVGVARGEKAQLLLV